MSGVHGIKRLAAAAEYLVDDQVGVIQFVKEVEREAGGPNFFHYAARAANTRAFCGQKNFADTGGAATDRPRAAAKALGEAVERYCSAIYELEAQPVASFEGATFECVPPSSFALFSERQYARPGFQFLPFNVQTSVRWTEMLDLGRGKSIYAPAARVFMPYTYYQGTGDTPIDQPISTGLACHMSLAQAAIGGLCEVVERDAVSICWQAQVSPPQILVETLDDVSYGLVERFEVTGSQVTLFNLTLDHGIPTILSVLRGRHNSAPAMVVAAAAAPSPAEAARKSLEELAHSRRYCQYVRVEMPRITAEPPDFAEVRDQLTHLNFYTDYDNLPLARFLFESRKRVDFGSLADLSAETPQEELRELVRRVEGVGERVLLKDLSTPDVTSVGMSVVRVVIPGFHPIHMGHTVRSLGGTRLWTVPQKLGYPGIEPETGDNPAPHPYP